MEIKRIDPYLVDFSVDGAVAIACETGGVQLLLPDAAELLRGDIQWRRMRSPDLDGRVIDMRWSPTGVSAYMECVLACVLETGEALVLEDSSGQTEPWHARSLAGHFSACTWTTSELILASDDGHIEALTASELAPVWTTSLPAPHRVLQLASSQTHVGAVLDDNSVWVLDLAAKSWERLVEPSRFRVSALKYGKSVLFAARADGVISLCDQHYTYNELSNYVPGHLVVWEDEWAIIHGNGQLSRATKIKRSEFPIPEIKGHVFGAIAHPFLPVGLMLLGPVTADWEYPIVSWQWAKTAFFQVPRHIESPSIGRYSMHIYWLTLLVSEAHPPASSPEEPPLVATLSSDAEKAAATTEGLQAALDSLFASSWFDAQRLQWYLSAPQDRGKVVASMRAAIARLVCSAPRTTELDLAIARWYSAYLPSSDAQAAQLAQGEPQILSLKGDCVEESFFVQPEQGESAISREKHAWKRCCLTLLPLVSLNARVSLDHEFSAYKAPPGESAIACALLGAGRACVYSGTQWERPRY